MDGHSQTWVTAKEILEFNYDSKFEDRRDDGETLPAGQGKMIKFRELLGEHYFDEIEVLKQCPEPENVRIILAFES